MRVAVAVTCRNFGAVDPAGLALLDEAGYEVAVNQTGRHLEAGEIAALAAGAAGIVAGTERFAAPLLARLANLRAISRVGAGTDGIDLDEARRHGIAVVRTPDAPAPAVAEMALALILALARHVPRNERALRAGTWKAIPGALLAPRTLGVVGLGRVGRRLVEIAKPLFARIIATEPQPDLGFSRAHGVDLLELDELLAVSDVVSLHVPADPAGRALIDARRLGLMKRGALLVNTARGGLVVEEDLVAALDSHLGGAALDVFAAEPYHGPLAGRDDVVLSPHAASSTVETRARMELEAARNLVEALGRG